jgi:hypothetical protein
MKSQTVPFFDLICIRIWLATTYADLYFTRIRFSSPFVSTNERSAEDKMNSIVLLSPAFKKIR